MVKKVLSEKSTDLVGRDFISRDLPRSNVTKLHLIFLLY